MVTKIFLFVFVLVPLTALISYRLAEALLWTGALLFAASTVKAIWKRRRDEPARKARLAAIIAAKPAYVVYGGGAPKWIAAPIFILFVAAAIALMGYEVLFGPRVLRGFNGFLTGMMIYWAIPIAMLAAAAVWRKVAWDLRSRFPDRLLLFANADGIGTSEGFVMPYGRIRRIDPCGRSSRFGTDNWIEIDDGVTHKVDLNMVHEPLDDVLTELRTRAEAAGARLRPAYVNGLLPPSASLLGYRRAAGYCENPWRAT